MRLLPALLIVLLMSTTTLTHVATSEETPYPRHTPGFPSNYLYDLANVFKDAFSNVSNQTSTNLTLLDLANSVSEARVRDLLIELIGKYQAGNLTPQDLDEAMRIVSDMYSKGGLSPKDYYYTTIVLEYLARSLKTSLQYEVSVDKFNYYFSKISRPEVRKIVEKTLEAIDQSALSPEQALEQSIAELNELYSPANGQSYIIAHGGDFIDIIETTNKLSIRDYVYAMAALRELARRSNAEAIAGEARVYVENMLRGPALSTIESYSQLKHEKAYYLSYVVQLAIDAGYTDIAEKLKSVFYEYVKGAIDEYGDKFDRKELDLVGYLEILEQLKEAAKRAGSNESLELINREILRVLGEYFTTTSSRDANSIIEEVNDIKSVLSKWGDYELLKLIDEKLSKSLVEKLSKLEQAYKSGYLSKDEYLNALIQLQRIVSTSGNQEALNKVLEAINNLLNVAQGEAGKKSLFEPPSINLGGLAKTPSGLSMPSIGLPSTPTGNIPLAQLGLLVLIALAAVSIVALARKTQKLSQLTLSLKRFITRHSLAHATTSATTSGSMDIITTYWDAVRWVEKRSGRSKSISETHREYLLKMCNALGDACDAFKYITKAYELARFAGVISEEMVERSRRAFEALTGDMS